MKDKNSIKKIRPRIAYIFLIMAVAGVAHYFWTAYYGRPAVAVQWWNYFDLKWNFFWQKYLPVWKAIFLLLALLNVVLLDLWITHARRASSSVQFPDKLAKMAKAMRAENLELKQQLNLSRVDLTLNDLGFEEQEREEWAKMRSELEAQLANANLDHKNTWQAFDELQAKLQALTQQLGEGESQIAPLELFETEPVVCGSEADRLPQASAERSQKFKTKLQELKSFIDHHNLA